MSDEEHAVSIESAADPKLNKYATLPVQVATSLSATDTKTIANVAGGRTVGLAGVALQYLTFGQCDALLAILLRKSDVDGGCASNVLTPWAQVR